MTIRFDTSRQEKQESGIHRVLGKILSGLPAPVLIEAFALFLRDRKDDARTADLLRIAAMLNVEVPAAWRRRQQQLIDSDAELAAKQQVSAAASRRKKVEKRRAAEEVEAREAAFKRSAAEWWQSRGSNSEAVVPGEAE